MEFVCKVLAAQFAKLNGIAAAAIFAGLPFTIRTNSEEVIHHVSRRFVAPWVRGNRPADLV
jgi:hypothetical protein